MRTLPVGLHGAFQVAWALAMAFPVAAKVEDLLNRPHAAAALAVIEVGGIWALGAAMAWAIRVLALSTCGTWGARTRTHVRDAERRRAS